MRHATGDRAARSAGRSPKLLVQVEAQLAQPGTLAIRMRRNLVFEADTDDFACVVRRLGWSELPRSIAPYEAPAGQFFGLYRRKITMSSIVMREAGPAANNLGRSAEYCRRSDPRNEATH